MRSFLAICTLSVLAACSTMSTPQSLDESLAYAEGQVGAAEQSVANALTAHAVSVAVAKQALAYGDQITAAINAARAAETGGDTATAQGKLALATSLLNQLAAYLAAQGVKQ